MKKKRIINGTHYIPDVSQISTVWTGCASQIKPTKYCKKFRIVQCAMCTENEWKKEEKRKQKMNYRNNNTVQTQLIASASVISLRQRIDDDHSNE